MKKQRANDGSKGHELTVLWNFEKKQVSKMIQQGAGQLTGPLHVKR
jgi:hypothetical protein